jgi:NADPH2:quinone reductase
VRAVVASRHGGPEVLEVSDVADPVLGAGQILVEVEACSVTFPDLLMLRDMYQFKPGLPFIPGGEVAGVVRQVGPGVEGFEAGSRVIGSTGSVGGMAELALTRADSTVALPAGADPSDAAGLLYGYGTSYHALADRARLAAGETLVVLGAAGGVGLAAVELGRAMGARVIAAASSPDKLAVCVEHGADATIDYSRQDLKEAIRSLTGGQGADVVFDPVGGPYSEPALRSTAWDGRFLVVGFAAGEIPRIPLNLALLRGASIVGVFWGAFASRYPQRNRENLTTLVGWWQDGRIRPHTSASYPLAQAADALADLDQRRATGKVVVRPRS